MSLFVLCNSIGPHHFLKNGPESQVSLITFSVSFCFFHFYYPGKSFASAWEYLYLLYCAAECKKLVELKLKIKVQTGPEPKLEPGKKKLYPVEPGKDKLFPVKPRCSSCNIYSSIYRFGSIHLLLQVHPWIFTIVKLVS